MIKIYEDNGLPFLQESDIEFREYCIRYLTMTMQDLLLDANQNWRLYRIESPTMIPNELVSAEYSSEDVYKNQDFTMRPETTAASYAYASYMGQHQIVKPPFCVYQAAKSYRRENDQVKSNVRLKEFYQLEYQCIYTEGTQKDYHDLSEPLAEAIGKLLNLPVRVVLSDRLPSYSEKTLDIEVETPHKWLEICSISKRNDVPFTWMGKKLLNTEFAFGLDRLCYIKAQS
jgi:glycyl-tRNA synthetase